MPVDLRCERARARRYARMVTSDARNLLRLTKMARGELSIVLTDDRSIRSLNRRFRGKDKATDVLSFPQLDDARRSAPSRIPTPIGDIAISIETASRQAAELKQTVAHRLRSLVIHGYLHLLGYDHERSPADARRMFSREAALAKALPPIRSRRSTV